MSPAEVIGQVIQGNQKLPSDSLAVLILKSLQAAGYVVTRFEPTQGKLLMLGLLSAAGPRSREQYVEVYQHLVSLP